MGTINTTIKQGLGVQRKAQLQIEGSFQCWSVSWVFLFSLSCYSFTGNGRFTNFIKWTKALSLWILTHQRDSLQGVSHVRSSVGVFVGAAALLKSSEKKNNKQLQLGFQIRLLNSLGVVGSRLTPRFLSCNWQLHVPGFKLLGGHKGNTSISKSWPECCL